MTRITDIVDNRTAEGFAAEHGLSLLIEHDGERILFDTGAGAALRPNAAKLVLLHCTGETAGAKLKEMLSCPVVWGSAGSVLIDGTM